MPKIKTHSGAKKRFKVTASGKIKSGQTGKRHFLRHCSKEKLRDHRGTTVLCEQDTKRLLKLFLPNSIRG